MCDVWTANHTIPSCRGHVTEENDTSTLLILARRGSKSTWLIVASNKACTINQIGMANIHDKIKLDIWICSIILHVDFLIRWKSWPFYQATLLRHRIFSVFFYYVALVIITSWKWCWSDRLIAKLDELELPIVETLGCRVVSVWWAAWG